MGGTSATVAAASVTIANAIKACGTIVRVEPDEFLRILDLQDSPLIVCNKGGFLSTSYRYLTSYKGLAFFCKSRAALNLPGDSQLIQANKISIPDM